MSSFFNPNNKKYISPGEKCHIQLVNRDCSTQAPKKRSVGDLMESSDSVPLESRDVFTNAGGVNVPGGETGRRHLPGLQWLIPGSNGDVSWV